MRKRKKPKKKKPTPSSLLSKEEERLLNSLLQNLKSINLTQINEHISSPEIAEALVEKLPADDPDALHLILAVGEAFSQKSVQKAVKKSLFRLKQRGISVPDLAPQKGPPILVRQPQKIEPTAYLGPIDGVGSRGIFLALPQIPKGVDVGMGVVNDEDGIVNFVFGRYSKKRMGEVKELFFQRFRHMVEASISHVATILDKAYQESEQKIGESSSDYLSLRPWILENVSLLEQAAIYNFIPLKSISREILTQSQIDKLLDHELMKPWIIDPEKMRPLLEEIQKAKESPILVSEAQRAERINKIKIKGITEIYPEEKRPVLKRRLEETAYIFFRLGEGEYARLSLAASLHMVEKDSILKVNPFLNALVEHSLDYYEQMAQELAESKGLRDDSTSSIIIP